jgi:hypothetical protein
MLPVRARAEQAAPYAGVWRRRHPRGRYGLVYEQVYEPVAGSLALSALVAAIPILVLFVLLAGVRVAAQWASLATLAVALVIAFLVYGMPWALEYRRLRATLNA